MKWNLAIALLIAPFASAEVVISQVLYDPVGTESGGEAIELLNRGSVPVDVSGWVLATDSSEKDVTLPLNTILLPGASLLVADEGWSAAKDNSGWRAAQYEEKMTLGNSNSGVSLLANNTVIDSVGWGNSSFAKGSPAVHVEPGKSLLRTGFSGDNSRDFIAVVPDFFDGFLVPVTADVSISVPIIEVSKSVDLSPEGTLTVKNNGAVPIQVRLAINDLWFRNNTIGRSAVRVEGGLEFSVAAQSEYRAKVRLDVPSHAVPGRYVSTMRVRVV
ncbi:lamin tail domain-containing protein [Candidatus Woesearchaeota archaeon]|nr:lamin tail domain-containing protein [Candidatus Woesearchaeota archaeon]